MVVSRPPDAHEQMRSWGVSRVAGPPYCGCGRRTTSARRLVEEARRVSRDRGTTALSHTAEALIALNDGPAREEQSLLSRWRSIPGSGTPSLSRCVRLRDFGASSRISHSGAHWLQRVLAASSRHSLAALDSVYESRGQLRPRPASRPRESEVHELLAQGLTNEEIAKLLYISRSTTKVHVKHIYEKLGVRSRLEAARALRDDV